MTGVLGVSMLSGAVVLAAGAAHHSGCVLGSVTTVSYQSFSNKMSRIPTQFRSQTQWRYDSPNIQIITAALAVPLLRFLRSNNIPLSEISALNPCRQVSDLNLRQKNKKKVTSLRSPRSELLLTISSSSSHLKYALANCKAMYCLVFRKGMHDAATAVLQYIKQSEV